MEGLWLNYISLALTKKVTWKEENFVEYRFAINEPKDGLDDLYIKFTDAGDTKVNMNLDRIVFKQNKIVSFQ